MNSGGAIVREVNLQDTDSELLYSIKVKTNIGSGKSQVERIAFPLDTNIKRTPVVGEMVYLVPRVSSDSSSPDASKPILYYTN